MAGILATAAAVFVSSVGINTHIDMVKSSYQNFAQMENALAYLRILNVRDMYDNPNDPAEFLAMANSLGLKFDFNLALGNVPIPWQLRQIEANYGIVAFVEGYNESDTWWQTYNGQAGIAATQAVQEALYSAVKADPQLAGVGVIQASFANLGTFGEYGDMSAYADFANTHTYFATGNNPGGAGNKWTQYLVDLAQVATPSKPTITTESGWFTMPGNVSGVDGGVQAKYTLNLLFEQAQAGIQKNYLYELSDGFADNSNKSPQDHYGLFNADWSAKPAANAISAMMTILSDKNSTVFTPGALNYTLSGLPPTASSSLLQKSDGTFILAVWNDERLSGSTTQTDIPVAPVTATLTLDRAYGSIKIYDPIMGSSAVQSYTDVGSITVAVPDHPVLIAINSKPSGAVLLPIISEPNIFTTPGVTVQVQGLTVTDSSAATLRVAISSSSGLLSVQDISGHVLRQNQHSVLLSGSPSVINAELATLSYQAGMATGADTLWIRAVDDSGHATQYVANVQIIAQPTVVAPGGPVLTLPAQFSVTQKKVAAFPNVTLTDIFAAQNAGEITATASALNGKLSVTSSGGTVIGVHSPSVKLAGTFAQVSAALSTLCYTARVPGADNVTVAITDQAGFTATQTSLVTVTP